MFVRCMFLRPVVHLLMQVCVCKTSGVDRNVVGKSFLVVVNVLYVVGKSFLAVCNVLCKVYLVK